jgi:AcrR family transcriptional regulator
MDPAPPPRRKRVVKSAEDRREDILAAGRQVFATTGFAECTVDDIVVAAQTGKGTFYRQFTSKDHLLGALWERYVDAIVGITQDTLGQAPPGDWWPVIDEVMSTLIRHAVENADLHRIVYGQANAAALEICRQANRRVIDLICDYVNLGAADGAFQARDPAVAFRIAYHGIDGLLDDLISETGLIDAGDLTADALQLIHRALGDPGPYSPPAAAGTSRKGSEP